MKDILETENIFQPGGDQTEIRIYGLLCILDITVLLGATELSVANPNLLCPEDKALVTVLSLRSSS